MSTYNSASGSPLGSPSADSRLDELPSSSYSSDLKFHKGSGKTKKKCYMKNPLAQSLEICNPNEKAKDDEVDKYFSSFAHFNEPSEGKTKTDRDELRQVFKETLYVTMKRMVTDANKKLEALKPSKTEAEDCVNNINNENSLEKL